MTVQIFRPNSTDVTNGTVTVVGTGGASGVTDDAPADDASYVTSFQWGAGVSLGIQDIALAGNERIRAVRARLRMFHNSADVGHVDEIDFRFRDGQFANLSAATTMGTSSNSAVEKTTGWYTSFPGKGFFEWTDARFDRVQANIAWRARSTTPPNTTQLRVTEVYVEADVHVQLSITSVTITGNTTSSKPTITWALAADPDLDAQTRWQVKIFTLAQFSAGNFNPDTSAATWDSGIKTGAKLSTIPTVNLVDGVSYRAYVRVAKNWVPSGTVWWSAWANSSTFAEALTAPVAPILSVTQELTLPSYRNRLVATTLGLNDLSADTASFEGGTLGNWVAGTNANTPTVSGTNPKSGSFAGSVTAVAAGNVEILSGTFATSRRVKPGAAISATVSTRAVTAARTVQIGIRWFDVAGATISTPMSAGNANVTTGYTTHTLANQIAPVNAYSYVIRVLIVSAAAAGEQHRFDEAGGMRGASATWAQGGYTQSGSLVFARLVPVDPTEGAMPAGNWIHEQLRSGGAYLKTAEGFFVRAATDEIQYLPLDRAHPGNPDTSGEGMIDWLVRAGATSFLDIGGASGVATDLTWPYLMPVIPGMSFTFGAWVWVEAGTRLLKYGINFVDEDNTFISNSFTGNITVTTTPQFVTVAATAPANSVYARASVDASPAAATGWRHRMTGLMFRPTNMTLPNCNPLVPWEGMGTGQIGTVELEIIRGADAVAFPIDGDPNVAVYDHEAPPDRPVIYTARLVAQNLSGDAISSPLATMIPVYMTSPARTMIKDVFDPQRAAIVNITKPSSQARNMVTDETELHGLNRDEDPVFVRAWRGHERSFELTSTSYLESLRLERLLSSSRALLIQWIDGGQTYIRVKNPGSVRFTEGKDHISITASEKRRP